ncbi:MAG: transporter substrate-binding domain-containing protein [Desulfobacterales bacterium]|nr:transporter substrate-binding domain-containing protein [Desulfobacterales bacterium]MCP4159565.1 transporter substrate-binding domain-containing protein [Deltaproteobacteria bacterium]
MKRFLLLFLLLPLNLSGAEKHVTAATLEWAPYIGKTLPNKGYVHEITVTAFKRSSYSVKINFYPWARAVYLVEKGNNDVLLPEYYSKKREKTCIYSNPIPGGPVGLYKQKSLKVKWLNNPQKKQTKALWGFRKYKFGVVRGYINTEEFDKAKFLVKEDVTNDELNIKKLHGNRIDFIFIDKFVAQYIIKTKYPHFKYKLEFMEPAMELKPLYLTFSRKGKNFEEKLKAFNDGLAKMKKDGTLKRIMQKHNF